MESIKTSARTGRRAKLLHGMAQAQNPSAGLTLNFPGTELDPGGLPHYYGPYANFANSPMPKGPVSAINLENGGSGYTAPTVIVKDYYGTNADITLSPPTVTHGIITAISVSFPLGTSFTAPIVVITDATGTGAVATATINGDTFAVGNGLRKFIDPLPLVSLTPGTTKHIPQAVPDTTSFPAGGKGYTSAPNVIITDATGTLASATAMVSGGHVTGFTNLVGGSGYSSNPTITLTGGGATTQAVCKAIVDPLTPHAITAINLIGCDYYEIALIEYTEQMHTDLANPTRLRGYVQLKTAVLPGTGVLLYEPDGTTPILMPDGFTQAKGVDYPHYLGPIIVASRDKPIRVRFYNLLPKGSGGDLFLPVDTTMMGAGMGPNPMIMAASANASGYTATITTVTAHGFVAGQLVELSGFTPTAYNGVFHILSVTPTTFTVNLSVNNPGVATHPGDVMELYTQNRATVHLHGGSTAWISDGTPHQWTTPHLETTSYPRGVSVYNVPDMPDGGSNPAQGILTFFYNNEQSARLMFFHDHAYGITRLNVYAGEAGAYLIQDPVELDMINGTNNTGINPSNLPPVLPDIGIPLVIQDKTFVDQNTIAAQDPTWNWGTGARALNGKIKAGKTGDLWYPHVYMPNQNKDDPTGQSGWGRWQYAPFWWPPADGALTYPPIPNPYNQLDKLAPNYEPWTLIPPTPNPSSVMEAFMDTPIVNGTAYPYLPVQPRAYRFRILNVCDDRFLNLQLYVATSIISNIALTAGGTGYTAPVVTITDTALINPGRGATAEAFVVGTVVTGIKLLTVGSGYNQATTSVTITDAPGGSGIGASATATVYTGLTEVGMVPAIKTSGYPDNWPTDGRVGGVPDPNTAGPSIIQIGTEGGFLPAPVVLPNTPSNWEWNQQLFDFSDVVQGTLTMGPAERADVIIDFSAFANKTLILYNDAPAGFPAIDPRYDYFTLDEDQTNSGANLGGAPPTQPGHGPNIRTIMQFVVGDGTATPYVLSNLQTVFAKTGTKRGVFEVSQPEIIIPSAAYNSAYNANFPADTYVRINDSSKTFQTVSDGPITVDFQMKALQDEMGEAMDVEFGRQIGLLGLELQGTTALNQSLILLPFASPPVELIKGTMFGTHLGTTGDGVQIWMIVHNGVDSHAIHVHLFNVQLINRVAWDNLIRAPDANELGWKDTVRVNPLENTIIALRPIIPTQPFPVPNSKRLIDPTLPNGAPLAPPLGGFSDPQANGVTIDNHEVNFGWEYMWHCHLLAHEEMDMMHTMVFAVPPEAPTNLFATPGTNRITLNWRRNSASEDGFTILKDTNPGFPNPTTITVGQNVTTYIDSAVSLNVTYYYKVQATSVVGDTTVYAGSPNGFPNTTLVSAFSAPANATIVQTTPPAIPTLLLLSAIRVGAVDHIVVIWRNNANNQTGFQIRHSTNSSFTGATILPVIPSTIPIGATGTTTDTVTPGSVYYYEVRAVSGAVNSGWSNAKFVVAA